MSAPKCNSNATGNKGGGRNSAYDKKHVAIAYKVSLLGATDTELADIFEVSERTINNWKKDHIEFSSALKKGKA